MNRETALRRLAALRAKFSDGSNCTPPEIEAAMRMYADLKAKYDISDTEEHIKAEGITHASVQADGGKQMAPICYIIPKIARYTDTYGGRTESGKATFIGTKADIEHATWIFTLVQNALEVSWKAYRYSFDYTKLHRAKVHGRTIRDNFHKGFIANVAMRLDTMIAEKMAAVVPGNQLAICKKALIQAFVVNHDVSQGQSTKTLTVRDGAEESLYAGYQEGDKVGLRQTMKNETKYLTHAGD